MRPSEQGDGGGGRVVTFAGLTGRAFHPTSIGLGGTGTSSAVTQSVASRGEPRSCEGFVDS
jgi:hypothetical protein